MKRIVLAFLFAISLSFISTNAFSQNFQVCGRVTSTYDGEPVMFVSVVFDGTNIGTATDEDGYYVISVPSDNGTLVFSGLGYFTERVPINGRSVIDVLMTEDCVIIGSEGDSPDYVAHPEG